MEIFLTLCIIALYSFLHLIKPPFGVVFDSNTGEYIDSATVVLTDAHTNREIARTISTMNGRYAFFVPAGSYHVHAERTHFEHAHTVSLNMLLYGLPCLGTVIQRTRDSVISTSIPMRQIAPDWNHQNKIQNKKDIAGISILWRKLCLVVGFFAVLGSLYLALDGLSILDGVLCVLSILWWVLFLFTHLPVIGQVRFRNKQPLPGYIDVVGYGNILIRRIPTTDRGRYWSLVPSGVYDLYIYAQEQGTARPQLLKSVKGVHCDRGILNKVFFV